MKIKLSGAGAQVSAEFALLVLLTLRITQVEERPAPVQRREVEREG